MQIVPVSSRFRQNVLQFASFFFSRSAIRQWSRILIPKNVHWNALKITTEISNVVLVILKNARLKEVLSDYQKWRFQFQILQILTCTIVTQNVDGKFHRHFQAMAENATMEISIVVCLSCKKQNHSVMPQSLNDDEKFCRQCYTNAENVNILSKIISQTGCKWLPL